MLISWAVGVDSVLEVPANLQPPAGKYSTPIVIDESMTELQPSASLGFIRWALQASPVSPQRGTEKGGSGGAAGFPQQGGFNPPQPSWQIKREEGPPSLG